MDNKIYVPPGGHFDVEQDKKTTGRQMFAAYKIGVFLGVLMGVTAAANLFFTGAHP